MLRGQGASQKAIARAADLNVKTIAELENEVLARIRPETEQDILALTIDRVRQFEKAGRWGGTEPAAPVLRLVDELTGLGWPKAWIAREIGQRARTPARQRRHRERRPRPQDPRAPAARGVHDRAAAETRQELPPLAEIIATDQEELLPRLTEQDHATASSGQGRSP